MEPMDEYKDLERISRDWPAEDKIRALEIIKARTDTTRRIWYCSNPGRNCDGKPHKGYNYPHARADQWPPKGTDWSVWLVMSGRGTGKTRTGAEWVRSITKYAPRIALVGRRGVDVRQTMIEGDSGLRGVCETAGVAYEWAPTKREFKFANGAIAIGYSAEEPAALRGPQFQAGWFDEPAHMDLIEDCWDNYTFGARLPGMPGGVKTLLTSTPLPIKWLKTIKAHPKTRTVSVPTLINRDNLDPIALQAMLDRFAGTRHGRQELEGELLEEVEGALWAESMIERLAPAFFRTRDEFTRIIVSVDPAGSNNKRSDETGIMVVGRIGEFSYVLEDVSGKYSPNGWSKAALNAYRRWGADAITAEKNFGGDMVKSTIESTMKDMNITARIIVTHAARSKELRAEPVVALYEQNRAIHNGTFEKLEEEMLTWVPGRGKSPNRIDALVWGMTELMKLQSFADIATPSDLARSAASGSDMPAASSRSMELPVGFNRRRAF